MPSRSFALVLVISALAFVGCIEPKPPATPAVPEAEPGMAQLAPQMRGARGTVAVSATRSRPQL